MPLVTVLAFGGTVEQRQLARDVTRWFSDQHLNNVDHDIRVRINFKDRFDCYGSATWNGEYSHRASSYRINVRAKMPSRKLLIETLVHELVHVEQMIRGDLFYVKDDNDHYRTFWKGVRADHLNYYKQPWEKEAYGREKPLLTAYRGK